MARIKEIVCIDFGSTNSQIGHRYVDLDTGKNVDWNEKDLTKNLINDVPEKRDDTNIPTELLEWVGKDEKIVAWEREYPAGKEVDPKARELFKGEFRVIREFKKSLFIPEKEKTHMESQYKEACRWTGEFLKFLYDIKEKNVANAIIPDEVETIITLPVRSTNIDMAKMKELAERAGFKNVTTRDEATSALDYAIFKKGSALLKRLEGITIHQSLNVLLVDIGGSTTDILHAVLKNDGNGSYVCDYKTQWPSPGETDTLGGIDIDKKVAELVQQRGYIIDFLAEDEIEQFGYSKFRKFKEQWSNMAKVSRVVPALGALDGLDYDRKTRSTSKVYYADDLKDNEKLSGKDFENLIREYVIKMQKAIRYVLKHDNIKEEEIDFIILSGGSSQMYGIEEMFLGKLDVPDRLNFAKIKKDHSALIFGESANPSAVCCLGNLLEKAEIECTNHVNGEYKAEIDVYLDSTANLIAFSNQLQKPKTGGLTEPPSSARYQFTVRCPIAKDLNALPIKRNFTLKQHIKVKAKDNILLRITVYRKQNDEHPNIEMSYMIRSERTLTQTLSDWWHSDTVRDAEILVKADCTMSENRSIAFRPGISGGGFDADSTQFKTVNI